MRFQQASPRQGGKTQGGSPLTLDVSKVPSTRFRVQSNISIFCVLENEGRNNCKMLLKMGFQWMHKCVKWWPIVKRSMKIKCPENLRMEMTKQGEIQALQSLIYEYPPTQNRNFNFSIFVEIVFQMAPKALRNWGLRVPLAPKTCKREVSKAHKNQHQKSKKICQKCAPKR